MSNRIVILQGSSRSDGNTRKISDYVGVKTDSEFIDLNQKKIGYFDYEFANRDDDFLPTMRKIIDNYDSIIFATPVYWYSMSAVMKTFFDRISDLLFVEKELGRKLKGKNMGMVSCSSDANVPETFATPFSETANYLGMNYLGDAHAWIIENKIASEARANLDNFIAKISNVS